jgi:Arc/MetJ-type ribon-helix-helix transcriptional regulator
MPRLTATVDEEQVALIEELSSDDGQYASKSEAVRACIQAYERVAELETENDRLRREKRAVIEQRDEHRELVEYVEGERELQQMERERRNAPIWRRLKWFIWGKD